MVNVETKCCQHVWGAAWYVNNDGVSPPVIYLDSIQNRKVPLIITLTNQLIKIQCPACFEEARLSAEQKLPLGKRCT